MVFKEVKDKFSFLRTFKDSQIFKEFKDEWEACIPRLPSAHPTRDRGPPIVFNNEDAKMGSKFGVCVHNFGARGSNLTKLYHVSCREAGMIMRVQFFFGGGGPAPLKFGSAKAV